MDGGRLTSPDLETEQELIIAAREAVLFMTDFFATFGIPWDESKAITRLDTAIQDFEASRK